MNYKLGEPGGFGSFDAATGSINWINRLVGFVGNDSVLVQDGETYRQTNYPDVQ